MLEGAIVLAFLVATLGAAPQVHAPDTTSTQLPVLSAAQVYDRALGFARSQRYPPYVSFIVTVHAQLKDRWLVEQFQSVCRTRDDRVITDAKPLSTTNQGDNPYGFNVKVRGLALHNSKDIDEPLGLPEISPIFAFGLVHLHPSISAAREYDAELVGVETFRDRAVYHLSLPPRSDPAHNRLRELWIDATTFAVLRLTSAGAFASGPATAVTWDVSYSMNHGRWVIDNEATSTPMLLGGYAPALNSYVPLPGAVKYYSVSYSFSNFTFPTQVSDLLFFEFKKSQAVQM
jgi:hypothetical protein